MSAYVKRLAFAALAILLSAQAAPKGELKVAVGLALPPYIIQGADSGIEVDILRQALPDYAIKLVYVPFIRVPRTIKDGSVDAALTMRENADTKGLFFSDSHIAYRNVVVTLKSRALKVSGLADLAKLDIIAFQNAATYLGPEFAAMAAANPSYREMAEQGRQIMMLFLERTDAIVLDQNIYAYLWRNLTDKRAAAPVDIWDIFPKTDYRIAFKSAALRDAFNVGLKRLNRREPSTRSSPSTSNDAVAGLERAFGRSPARAVSLRRSS